MLSGLLTGRSDNCDDGSSYMRVDVGMNEHVEAYTPVPNIDALCELASPYISFAVLDGILVAMKPLDVLWRPARALSKSAGWSIFRR